MNNQKFKPPFLVQRCSFNGRYKNGQKVSEYLNLDYMGSAEFEFGTIPKNLRYLNDFIDKMKIRRLDGLPEFGSTKGVCWYMTIKECVPEVEKWLKELANGRVAGLKEDTYFDGHFKFDDGVLGFHKNHDVWFTVSDFFNTAAVPTWPLVFSLKKEPLNHFAKALAFSIEFMDAKREESKA